MDADAAGDSGISELIAQMPGKEHRIQRRRLAEHQGIAATPEGIKAPGRLGSAQTATAYPSAPGTP
jgi:hypothetical protein